MDAFTRRVAFGLIAADFIWLLLFVVAFFIAREGYIDKVPTPLHLEHHLSLPSFWVYAKFALCAVVLWQCWTRARDPLFRALAVVFVILIIDDAFEIHEALGIFFADALRIPEFLGLVPQDRGEPIAYALLGLVCLTVLFMGYRQASAEARKVGLNFLKLFVALAVFGAAIDFIHGVSRNIEGTLGRATYFGLTVLEDGGEMVVVSLMAIYALHVQRAWAPSMARPA